MLIKSLAGLSALMGALAMIDFEPAGEATIQYNILPDRVEMVEVYGAGANNTTSAWQCDVRAWTRAPDLSPGKVLPADARLAANGSACGDIVKWEVGMRLKERALIKIKAKGVEFPVEPIRPVWNESFYAHRQNDYNDVMQSNMYYSSHQDPAEKEYDEAMSVYQEKVRNSSLWLISGQERVVYDLTREMDLGHDRSEHMDLVESFAIHMPRTNFPPIERYSGWSSGGSDQMLVTETLSEFYHLVTLANGTILDLPSGEIGIIPASSSIKPKSAVKGVSIGENAWPQTVDFPPTSHNRTEKEESESRFRYLPVAPQCVSLSVSQVERAEYEDEYNAANFTLRVHSNVTQPILGQNITLNITLTRTGNGSEYPAWINVAHATPNNITWAYQFVANDSEYSDLRDDMSMRGVRFSAHGAEPKLRMASSTRDLENEKKDKERGMDGNGVPCGCEYYGGWGDFGSSKSRYYMLEDGKEPQEEYTFGLEIALPEREIPSFEKTFERFRSSLVFTLNTYFACDTPSLDSADGSAQTGPAVSELDKEWDTYALPTRECKRSKILTHGNMYSHTTMVPLDARLDPVLTGAAGSDEASADVVHYLDDAALSPMLSASVQDAMTFSPLNQAVRDEKEDERKRSRWGPGMRGRQRGWCERENASPRCWELNGGGADKVASTMWQSKLAKEQEAFSSRADGTPLRAGTENKNTNKFVVQA